jgi:hypothetical protein
LVASREISTLSIGAHRHVPSTARLGNLRSELFRFDDLRSTSMISGPMILSPQTPSPSHRCHMSPSHPENDNNRIPRTEQSDRSPFYEKESKHSIFDPCRSHSKDSKSAAIPPTVLLTRKNASQANTPLPLFRSFSQTAEPLPLPIIKQNHSNHRHQPSPFYPIIPKRSPNTSPHPP